MNKTTLYLTDELQRMLAAASRRTGRSQARLIREAVAKYLADEDRPSLKSIGAGEDPELAARESERWLRDQWSARDNG